MSDISFNVEPGYYLSPFTVNMQLSAAVESLQYSVNGGAPSISKYIAYDTLTPANPFIAVTQDGRGNVVYDGGFPKFYNSKAPSADIQAFENAIRLEGTRSSSNVGTNSYAYCKLSDTAVVIEAGDKLVFDVFGSSAMVMASVDGYINGSSLTPLRQASLSDQNGLNIHPSTDITSRAGNKWYHREVVLTALAGGGNYIDNWQIALENEAAGAHVAWFKEVYVLNSVGQIKATLFKDVMEFPTATLSATGQQFFSGIATRKVDARDQLDASFKYLYNALRFIENKTKVTAGNKKILVIGDASLSIHANYRPKGTNPNDFFTSLSRLGTIAGYTLTFKEGFDWGGSTGVINPTLAELEQYCGVVFMSTVFQPAGSAYLVTPEAVDAFLTYRENGNGLIFITDHGPVINTIGDAISSNKGGFFGTANAIITGFGAWFSGDYNRTPVNVGFLRTTYGDHPLYDSMLDSESIYAGASESRVNVASFTSIPPSAVPPISIPNGKTTIQVAAVLTSGAVVTYRAVYWVVSFKLSFSSGGVSRDNGQVLDIGVKNKAAITAALVGSLEDPATGIIYRRGVRVGTFSYSTAGGSVVTWDSGQNGTFQFNNGDEFKVVLSTPLALTSAITISRFQPPIEDNLPLASIAKTLRAWQPALTPIARMKKAVNDIAVVYPALAIEYSLSLPANLKLLKQHFNNQGITSARHFWKLVNNLSDSVGGKNATPNGTVSYASVGGKSALKLTPGSNAWANISSLSFGAEPWSVNLWYNPTNFNDYHHLLSSTDNATLVFKLGKSTDAVGAQRVYVSASSFSVAGSKVGTGLIPAGEWSMFTFTFTGTVLKIYVNGVLRGEFNLTMNVPTTNFKVGHYTNGTVTEQSSGYQRELSIYDNALSVEEILELYAAG